MLLSSHSLKTSRICKNTYFDVVFFLCIVSFVDKAGFVFSKDLTGSVNNMQLLLVKSAFLNMSTCCVFTKFVGHIDTVVVV